MCVPVGTISSAALVLLMALAFAGCHDGEFAAHRGGEAVGLHDDLFSVSVVDANHVVAVGYRGAAYWSEDGGETWHEGATATERLLYAVSMADRRQGWAVGQRGTVLRTEDGGRSWSEQSNPKRDERTHLFGVHAIDGDSAIAVGEWGGRIRTQDGGRSWVDDSLRIGPEHPQFAWLSAEARVRVRAGRRAYEDVNLHDVFCLPGGPQCWLVGEFGTIYRSGDRGATWTRGEILDDLREQTVGLDFAQTALDSEAVARLATFAQRIEGRAHLNVLVDAFASGREIEAYYDGKDPDALFEILAARLDAARGALEQAGLATDRIRTYNRPPWNHAEFTAHDAAFVQRYVAGRRAREAGLAVSAIQNPVFFTVRFANEHQGLVAGLGGVILRSADAGRTWRYAETRGREALFAVVMSGARGLAVGERGAALYSEDGGRSWLPTDASRFPPTVGFLRDLRFASSDVRLGFTVGREGAILRSRDGGDSWTQVLPLPELGANPPGSLRR
jgi:photosystem II stability/assembly factor-like uncharacterized protein